MLKKRCHIYLSDKHIAKLSLMAEEEGLTRSEMIRRIIDERHSQGVQESTDKPLKPSNLQEEKSYDHHD
jgi:macrodomain Ter protein organizer (MatP/YcbG family)